MTLKQTGPHANDSLRLGVPPAWSIVHLNRLLDLAFPRAITQALGDDTGGADALALEAEFAMLRDQVVAEHLVFLAVRTRTESDGFDLMTLATLDETGTGHEGTGDPKTASRTRISESVEYVTLANGDAIVHSQPPRTEDRDAFWRSSIQLTFLIPDSSTGAILTMLSTACDAQEELLKQARTVASSVGIMSVAPPSNAVLHHTVG